jgi:HlyD family secretion protein
MPNTFIRVSMALLVALLAGCADAPAPGWSGYGEGEYVYVSTPVPGRLSALAVLPGQDVPRGAALFTLDADAEQAARAADEARLAQAQAQAANTAKGRRTDEIAVVQAQLAQARAQAELAAADLARQQQLVAQGFIAPARLDDAKAALAQAQARVAELQLQQQRESVAVDVARARAELRRSRAAYAARQQNSLEAQEAFQLASLRFSRGLSTQLEVSDAQLALLTAQSTEARATYDLFLASADLARALGRPIPLPPTATTTPAPR